MAGWQQRLENTGGRLDLHARHYGQMPAEIYSTRARFAKILQGFVALPFPTNEPTATLVNRTVEDHRRRPWMREYIDKSRGQLSIGETLPRQQEIARQFNRISCDGHVILLRNDTLQGLGLNKSIPGEGEIDVIFGSVGSSGDFAVTTLLAEGVSMVSFGGKQSAGRLVPVCVWFQEFCPYPQGNGWLQPFGHRSQCVDPPRSPCG